MPAEDRGLGPAFIWTITCLLFLCIAGGGACLLAYMTTPDPDPDPSLAVAGFALVCLPWAFWLFTFAYRLLSRACGFRMVIGPSLQPPLDRPPEAEEGSAMPPNDTKLVEIGGASEMQRNVSSKSSVASHESQMPLASSS